jgi:uncharacterized membrane protein YccF (DUF307 family)
VKQVIWLLLFGSLLSAVVIRSAIASEAVIIKPKIDMYHQEEIRRVPSIR